MPRATSTSTEEKAVKKAPRKRAAPKKSPAEKKATPRKTTTRKAPAKKTTPRKTPIKKTETITDTQESELADVAVETKQSSTRKAPTKFAQEHATKKTKRNQYVVIVLLIVIGLGSSAAVGLSDSEAGQIDVTQTIRERNERMANLVDVNGPTVVAPTPSQQPDGGLIGLRPADPEPAPAPVATTTTATSTGATATSTATSTDSSLNDEEAVVAEPPAEQSATDTATTTVEAVDPEV